MNYKEYCELSTNKAKTEALIELAFDSYRLLTKISERVTPPRQKPGRKPAKKYQKETNKVVEGLVKGLKPIKI